MAATQGPGASWGPQPLAPLSVGRAAQGCGARRACVHDRELRREWVHRILMRTGAPANRRHRAGGWRRPSGLGLDREVRHIHADAAGHPLRGGRGHDRCRVQRARRGGSGLLAYGAVRTLYPPRAHLRQAARTTTSSASANAGSKRLVPPGQPRRRFRARRRAPRRRVGRRRSKWPSRPCASKKCTCCGATGRPHDA